MRTFKKLVVLDSILLTDEQWQHVRNMTDELVIYSGLTYEQIVEKLAIEQGLDPGAVCFTMLAHEEVSIEELNRRVEGADGIITCWTNIPDEVLDANPQVKYIGFWTNLVSHRINILAAEQRGVIVTHIPDYGTTSVSEYTFALLLELYRNVSVQMQKTLKGNWPYENLKKGNHIPSVEAIPYNCLRGKTLGIVGFGRIGQRVCDIALAFGMKVIYFSRRPHDHYEDLGVEYLGLDDLLRHSDIVSLHLSPYANIDQGKTIRIDDHGPPSFDDKPIVTRERLALIRDNGIFINTAAGRLIDQDALFDEAWSGRLRLAMDVYSSSPPLKTHSDNRKGMKEIVERHPKGYHVFTYRGGWFTREGVTLKGERLIEHLRKFIKDKV